jgi:hypothetical protein
MPIDVVGWDDAVSGIEDIVTGDDYTSLGDDFVSGGDDDIRSLLAAGDDYDVSGDELALSGAGFMPRMRMAAMAKKMAARAVARKGAVAVKSRGATAARRYPLGFSGNFNVTSSGAGGDLDITTKPQIPFRGERLTLPAKMGTSLLGPTESSHFVITDVKIGNRSQLVASTELPGQVFSENAFGVSMRFDTAQVAQDVVIRARYVGPLPPASSGTIVVTFRAAVLGTAIY